MLLDIAKKKQGMSKNLDHYAAAVGKETQEAVLTGVMRHLGISGNKGRENVTGYPKDRVKDHKETGDSAGLHHADAMGKETKKAVEKGLLRRLGVEIIEDRGPCGICRENVVGYRKDRVKDHKNIYYHEKCWDMKHPRKRD
jgi:hypothetical protein